MNKTLKYYNENAKEYFNKTVNVNMTKIYDSFLKYLSKGSHILDLGCGSGRDSLYFLNKNFKVTAIDGSKELCSLASKYTGLLVKNVDFKDISYINEFDGIWACASLLHLNRNDIKQVLNKLNLALKNDGVMYISLKLGENYSKYDEHDRFFTYYSKEIIHQLLKDTNFYILNEYITCNKMNDNEPVEWFNAIIKK